MSRGVQGERGDMLGAFSYRLERNPERGTSGK